MDEISHYDFRHNGLIYTLKWAESRFSRPIIAKKFGNKLKRFIHFTQSGDFPESLFNQSNGLRCSSFRIKNLITHGQKKMSIQLVKGQYVSIINKNNLENYPIKSISKLPKMAKIWYEINCQLSDKNPGHDPILSKILEINGQALATELPIWTVTWEAINNREIQSSPFKCFAGEIFTGHIDILLYDEQDGSLIVADYKPEGNFLRSLPQVAIYGLVLKEIIGYNKIKCVSFDRESAWVYDPEIIRTAIPKYLRMYGNPDLEWQDVVNSLV
ncbi:MAG: hypothetical protein ACTSRK_04015 [Promethearchaeota archaeon]